MKKLITSTTLILLTVFASSAFIIKDSNGIQGYAGSPGEGTCSNCHGGGNSSASGITITAVPAFSVNSNSDLEFFHDSTYQITIETSANGFTKFGFASQILNNTNTNAGTIQNAGSGVKFLNSGSKRTATHTTPKTATGGVSSFTYKWVAPSSGDAKIYAIANAVNGNGSTSGDFVVSPTSLPLVAAPEPTPVDTASTVGIKKLAHSVSNVVIYPNPANDIANISYSLTQSKLINIQLISIKGELIKELYKKQDEPGVHSAILNLSGLESGIYFVRILSNGEKMSQKLITIQ